MNEHSETLCGITTPLITPFVGTEIDWSGYDHVLDRVLAAGVDAVFPCGTTGEVASLTTTERLDMIERTVAATHDDVPVLVGGTGTSVAESVDWISEIESLGADIVVVTAPFFHPANEPDGYADFFEAVAAESALPIILYNIPACVGDEIPLSVIETVATHPQIIGLKDSGGDLNYGMQANDCTPDDFLVLQGFDPLLLPSLLLGFDGGINAVSNVAPDAYVTLVDDPTSENAMNVHNEVIRPLFELCAQYGFAPGVKAALSAMDEVDEASVRPPLRPVDPVAVSDVISATRPNLRE